MGGALSHWPSRERTCKPGTASWQRMVKSWKSVWEPIETCSCSCGVGRACGGGEGDGDGDEVGDGAWKSSGDCGGVGGRGG